MKPQSWEGYLRIGRWGEIPAYDNFKGIPLKRFQRDGYLDSHSRRGVGLYAFLRNIVSSFYTLGSGFLQYRFHGQGPLPDFNTSHYRPCRDVAKACSPYLKA